MGFGWHQQGAWCPCWSACDVPVATARFVIGLFKKMTFEDQQHQWFFWCGGWPLKLENHPLQNSWCFFLCPFYVLVSKASGQNQPGAKGSAAKRNYKAFREPDWLGKGPGSKEEWSKRGGDQGTWTWQGAGSWAGERRGRGGWDQISRKEAEMETQGWGWRGANAGAGRGGWGVRRMSQEEICSVLS